MDAAIAKTGVDQTEYGGGRYSRKEISSEGLRVSPSLDLFDHPASNFPRNLARHNISDWTESTRTGYAE